MRVDLAVIIVSTNEAKWLRACLSSLYEHTGPISIQVVVADNESTDGTRGLVESEFPEALVVACRNRGFGHGNNRGVEATDSRYVLFLNPDTEVLREHSQSSLPTSIVARRSGSSACARSLPTRCCSRRSVVSHRFHGPSSRRLARSGFR